jgi:hypothetical protein
MNNPLSFSSLKLDLLSKDGRHLKSASGFVVEVENRYYLITNRHVLSSKDTVDGKQESVVDPYLLKTSLHIHGGQGEEPIPLPMGMRKRITIPLYDKNNTPNWIEHRANGGHHPIVDIVALPIQLNLTLRLFSGKLPGINIPPAPWAENTDYWTKITAIPISAIDSDVEYGPPDSVHVIGYPFGWAPDGTNRSVQRFGEQVSLLPKFTNQGRAGQIHFLSIRVHRKV